MKPWSSLNSRLAISRRSSSIATDRRAAQGPWLTRDVINKHPVFVVDYKDLERPGSSTKRNDKSKANETVERGLLKDFRQVASFNWYGSAAKPVLIIPGSPRYFRSSWAGGVVKADVEERIISPHLYMTPDYPMESLFLSVKKCAELENLGQPNFDDYDIATDRIVLRRLLEFCRRRGLFHATTEGIGWRDIDLSIGLRIDAERVGERLVVLSRRESSMYELPSANRRRTFGQDFRRQITEEAPLFSSARLREVLDSVSTSPRIPIGTQYHIGTYRFGDLRFLVRFSSSCADIEKSYPIADPVDDGSHYSIEHVAGSNVGCIYAGQRHHYYTIELTTRRESRPFPQYKWSQMYLSHIDGLAIGWYQYRRQDSSAQVVPSFYTSEECRKMAEAGHVALASKFDERTLIMLHDLVSRIVHFVRSQPSGKKFAMIWSGKNCSQLEVFEKSDRSLGALPDYLIKDAV